MYIPSANAVWSRVNRRHHPSPKWLHKFQQRELSPADMKPFATYAYLKFCNGGSRIVHDHVQGLVPPEPGVPH